MTRDEILDAAAQIFREKGFHAASMQEIAQAVKAVDRAGALGGVLGWVTYATLSAIVGLVLGFVIAILLHKVFKLGAKH